MSHTHGQIPSLHVVWWPSLGQPSWYPLILVKSLQLNQRSRTWYILWYHFTGVSMIFPEHSTELYNHSNSLWPRDTISSGDMSVNTDSGNGSMSVRHRDITWTNVHLLLIGSLGTTLSEIWIRIQRFSVRKMWFENVFSKTSTIVFKPQCVCIYHLSIFTGYSCSLTHWGRATHICASNLTIIASDNGLSSGRRQAIIWTNAGISLIGPLAINFSEILITIQIIWFKKMYLKLSSAKWRLLLLGLNVLILYRLFQFHIRWLIVRSRKVSKALWNLAALLPSHLPNFKTIKEV